MTDPRDELSGALHRLRGEVRERISMPAAARLRARAVHRLRVRRTTTALVAAAAVAALVFGGTTLLNAAAAPPVLPADSPTPTGPPVTPSPRPAPLTPEPLDAPIANVDWHSATITLPPRDGCPGGPVSLTPISDIYPNVLGPADGFPKVTLNATDAAYGDVNGNGGIDAVVLASCAESDEELDAGHGTQLLVVSLREDGTLVGLAWVGPPGADILSYWTVGDRLLLDADPWVTGPEDTFPRVPGFVLSYQWEGDGFTGWEQAPDYQPVADPMPPVRPGAAVASGLGCPDADLWFSPEPEGGGWRASAPEATYAIPFLPHQGYLFDLDNTGDRLLVTALSCTTSNGTTTTGLAVFEQTGDGWRGISVLVPRNTRGLHSWSFESGRYIGREPAITVEWLGEGTQQQESYRWTGTVFEPIDG